MFNFWKQLPKPFLILAPMEQVTDFVFREIFLHLPRPDVFFTEFTNAEGLFSKGKTETVRRFKYSENQRPIVAQIWGTSPVALYKAAQLVKDLKFDGIDINMGCPEKTVVKKGAGAACIKNHALTKELIDVVKSGADGLPVSVKTRTGFDRDATEEWISFLLEQKIDALAIHGRTAKQMSKGDANWGKIGRAVTLKNKISPETLIIGNGDIRGRDKAQEMHQKYGVDGIMIGRGIFYNPWVFEKIGNEKPHSKEEYIAVLLKHVKLFQETWGSTKNYHIMKKFFKMYVKDFDGANLLRQQLMETKNHAQVEQLLLR